MIPTTAAFVKASGAFPVMLGPMAPTKAICAELAATRTGRPA